MIPYGKHHIDEDDIQAVAQVLRSDYLTQGPIIEEFERAIADYVGVKYAVAVSSGTAALHLANLAVDMGPGCSAVTSPITFVASANSILYAGGNVLFADIDIDTVNMSPEFLIDVFKKNKNIKAVIPVHFAGLPCDMAKIKQIADKHNAVVIEDAAHALGASYPSGKKVGSCENSLMTMFSFHPVKAIAAGEGGMITTNNEIIYRKLLRLRSHGINKLNDSFILPEQGETNGIVDPWYYEMQELGFHYRITDIQCALALSQLKRLDSFISRRVDLAIVYDAAFTKMKNCSPAQTEGRDRSGHHLYVLRINYDGIGVSRNQLMQNLRSRDIGSQVHYIPVPAHPFYRKLGFRPECYSNAQKYYQEALSIPLFFKLTDSQQKQVIDAIAEIVG
jgi:UDP-4-amino-4,6-dideoxy-N-acetyl-beta-L-altrosamine transaminase